jgi:hypothetical protein
MNADLRPARRHECRPTSNARPSAPRTVGRVSTRHPRRHECRPTHVGMNADLRPMPGRPPRTVGRVSTRHPRRHECRPAPHESSRIVSVRFGCWRSASLSSSSSRCQRRIVRSPRVAPRRCTKGQRTRQHEACIRLAELDPRHFPSPAPRPAPILRTPCRSATAACPIPACACGTDPAGSTIGGVTAEADCAPRAGRVEARPVVVATLAVAVAVERAEEAVEGVGTAAQQHLVRATRELPARHHETETPAVGVERDRACHRPPVGDR